MLGINMDAVRIVEASDRANRNHANLLAIKKRKRKRKKR